MRTLYFSCILVLLTLVLVLPLSSAAACDFTNINNGDVCPTDCEVDGPCGPEPMKEQTCHAICTYGDTWQGALHEETCDNPCILCTVLPPIENSECTATTARGEIFFNTYYVNVGREESGWQTRYTGVQAKYDSHYLSNGPGHVLRGAAFPYDLTGLGETPYYLWPESTQGLESHNDMYNGLIRELKVGVPFAYSLGVHDSDNMMGSLKCDNTRCGNIVKLELTYDPAEIEIIDIYRVERAFTCDVRRPGLIECYLSDTPVDVHLAPQAWMVARPLKAFTGQTFEPTVTILQDGFVLDPPSQTPFTTGATGTAVERSVAQLSGDVWSFAADVEAALWKAVQKQVTISPTAEHVLFYTKDDTVSTSSGETRTINTTINPIIRFTRTGAKFWSYSNEPRPTAPSQEIGGHYRYMGHYTDASGQSVNVLISYLEVNNDVVSGWLKIMKDGVTWNSGTWSHFEEPLTESHFNYVAGGAQLSCGSDGKTVKATSNGVTTSIGVCENSCVVGKCLSIDETPYSIFAGSSSSGALLTPECTPGEGRACAGTTAIKDICLDGWWSGCPAACVAGQTKTCTCRDVLRSQGTKQCEGGLWGDDCTNCDPCTAQSQCTLGDYRCSAETHGGFYSVLSKCVDIGCGKGGWVPSPDYKMISNQVCMQMSRGGGPFPTNVCGNYVVEAGEECDGNSHLCSNANAYNKEQVRCTADCTWDDSNCPGGSDPEGSGSDSVDGDTSSSACSSVGVWMSPFVGQFMTGDCCGDDSGENYVARKIERSPGTTSADPLSANICCRDDKGCPTHYNDQSCASYQSLSGNDKWVCGDDHIFSNCNAAMACEKRGGYTCCAPGYTWTTSCDECIAQVNNDLDS